MKYVCVMRVINNEAELAADYTNFVSTQGKTVYELDWFEEYVKGFTSKETGFFYCLLEVEHD